jgi:hypothetical protein
VLAGSTESPDLPTTENALRREARGSGEGFLAILELHPPRLDFATFIGGSGVDGVGGVAVDGDGAVWLVGATDSDDFPTTASAPLALSGWMDAFVLRVDVDQPRLLLSLLLGGKSYDAASAVAIDRVGAAFVAGQTRSENFPLRFPIQDYWRGDREAGDPDAFIAKISPVAYPRAPRIQLRRSAP